MRPLVNGRRARPRLTDSVRGIRLPDPPGAPPAVLAELHYLYALLVFSDAEPVSIGYTPATRCARIEYQRDGKPWVMVIRPAGEPA